MTALPMTPALSLVADHYRAQDKEVVPLTAKGDHEVQMIYVPKLSLITAQSYTDDSPTNLIHVPHADGPTQIHYPAYLDSEEDMDARRKQVEHLTRGTAYGVAPEDHKTSTLVQGEAGGTLYGVAVVTRKPVLRAGDTAHFVVVSSYQKRTIVATTTDARIWSPGALI